MKPVLRTFLVSLFTISCSTMPTAQSPQPPIAKKLPHVVDIHGERRVDDYFWMREKENPAVLKYLKAENAHTARVMKPTEKFQGALYREMLGHIKETDLSVPYRLGGWWYYSRTEQGKQYPIMCRKRGSLDAKEEIALDLNQLAQGKKFLGVGAFEVSDDGNLLAYSLDTTGFRQYTLHVKDLRTGKVGSEKIPKTGSVAWAADNRTIFYTVEDEAKRQYRLYRHKLGAAKDELIYGEKDELYDIGVERTRSRRFLLLNAVSKTTTEVRYLDAARPDVTWKIVAARQKDHEYDVDHHGETFYIRSNREGRNFGLYTAPVAKPALANWQVLVPHRTNVMLEAVELFATHYVLLERENALPRVTITDLASKKSRRIEFTEPAFEVEPESNPEWIATTFRYAYQSFITPRSVYDYDLAARASNLLKQTEVPGYAAAQYRSERVFAKAEDGTRIPISLVYKVGFKRDGSAPLLLDGYGSYGIVNDVRFSGGRLALLDRGVVFAQAHIRGGGELGKAWHDQGRMLAKKNSFTDFIAAAEFLLAQKYTAKDRLIITGGSAGGLLMGAVVNLRPELFKAVLTRVPFVDVINTMLDETLPLTVSEFEEWGNPKKRADYEYMKAYCPYSNLGAHEYPAMLVKTSFFDSQVMYWEPTKYVAKLRELKTDRNVLLYHINLSAGHGGSSGRYDYLKEIAFDYAFILGQVGITK